MFFFLKIPTVPTVPPTTTVLTGRASESASKRNQICGWKRTAHARAVPVINRKVSI